MSSTGDRLESLTLPASSVAVNVRVNAVAAIAVAGSLFAAHLNRHLTAAAVAVASSRVSSSEHSAV